MTDTSTKEGLDQYLQAEADRIKGLEQMESKRFVECPKCHRKFTNEAGLRMHTIRKHSGRDWDTSRNFSQHNATRPRHNETDNQRAHRLRLKRIYQRRLRARYFAEGKDSHGKTRPAGWKPRRPRHLAPSAMPEYRRAYQKKWYQKNKRNGVTQPGNQDLTPELNQVTPDITGEAAKAILVAASVLRAVTTGMKIAK